MPATTHCDVLGVVVACEPAAQLQLKNGTDAQKRALTIKDESAKTVEVHCLRVLLRHPSSRSHTTPVSKYHTWSLAASGVIPCHFPAADDVGQFRDGPGRGAGGGRARGEEPHHRCQEHARERLQRQNAVHAQLQQRGRGPRRPGGGPAARLVRPAAARHFDLMKPFLMKPS